MGLVAISTVGLVLWIVLWAIGAKSFDAFLITITLVVIGVAGRVASAYLPGRQNL